jgi:hypothetical protein
MTNIGKVILFGDEHCGMPHSYFDAKFVQLTLSYQYYTPQCQLVFYFITYFATQTVLAYSIEGKSKKAEEQPRSCETTGWYRNHFSSTDRNGATKVKVKIAWLLPGDRLVNQCDHGSVVG